MAEAKKGRGCFFYGCITAFVVTIVAVIVIFLGVRYALKTAVAKYTSPTPVAIAPVKISKGEGQRVDERLNDYSKALEAGSAKEPLELTSDEVDYLFRSSDKGRELKDAAQIMITNNQVRAQISFPLGAIRPELSGRFLNGVANLKVALKGGAVAMELQTVEVNGQRVPDQYLQGFKQEPIQWRPETNHPHAKLVENLGSVEIKDGKLVLHPRAK